MFGADEFILRLTGIYNFSDSELKRRFLADIKRLKLNKGIFAKLEEISYDLKDYYDTSEHRKRKTGNLNKDKTFYIVRIRGNCGWGFYIYRFLYQIDRAIKNGWIPVIDMSFCDNQYKVPGSRKNSWCDYFKQPCGYSLQTAMHSKNVIYAPARYGENVRLQERSGVDKDDYAYWRRLFKKYIRCNEKTQAYLDERYNRIIKGKRTLGVVCRGTEIAVKKPYMHDVLPSDEEILAKTEECLKQWDCEQIYLATEDQEVFGKFKEKFGSSLVYVDCKRYDKNETWLIENESFKKISPRQQGMDYLTTIYILSKCNCFIATGCGARRIALYMTEGFEEQYTYDLGFYGIDDDAYTLTPSGKPIYVKG